MFDVEEVHIPHSVERAKKGKKAENNYANPHSTNWSSQPSNNTYIVLIKKDINLNYLLFQFENKHNTSTVRESE